MMFRSLVALTLFLTTSTNAFNSNFELPKSRKTLNFGFDNPNSRFVTLSKPSSFIATPSRDPYEVAKDFIATISPQSREYSYRIRKDSYKDSTTRVTHVYVRQTYRGLDVANGDVNINILDGHIISYGNEVSQHDFFLVHVLSTSD
jgi:extracellular elastinolytic metalloproteinase